MSNENELLTIDEACDYLRRGRRAVKRLIDEGKLEAFKTERKWFIPRNSINDYIQSEISQQKNSNSERRNQNDIFR